MFKKFLVHVPKITGEVFDKKVKHNDGSTDTYVEYQLERVYSKERKNTSTKRTTIGKKVMKMKV